MSHLEISPDWLLRATGWVTVAALLALWALRRIRSPIVHRAACIIILLQGSIWFRWDLPVLPAPQAVEHSLIDATRSEHFTPRPDVAVKADLLDEAIRAVEQTPLPETVAHHETPPAISAPASIRIDWSFWIAAIWLAGMLAIIIVWVSRYALFQRRLPRIEEPSAVYRREWIDVCRLAGLRESIPLWGLAGLGPACGWMKRRIVVFVPAERWRQFTADQRRAVLLHEAAHLKRGDLWKSLAVRLLALPQWFNPLAWRLVRRFDEAAEWACDEFILRHQGSCAPEFAEALLSLTVQKNKRPQFTAAAVGHPLSERMRRLLSPTKPERTMAKSILLFVALTFFMGASLLRLSAQEPEKIPDPQPAGDNDPVSDQVKPNAPLPDVADTIGPEKDPLAAQTPAEAQPGDILFENPKPQPADTAPTVDELIPSLVDPMAQPPADVERKPDVLVDAPQPGAVPGFPVADIKVDAPGESEAVIDLSEVFRGSHYFQRESERVRAQLVAADERLQQIRDEAAALQVAINAGVDADEAKLRMDELLAQAETIATTAQDEMQTAEAEIYLNTYRRVRDVIAEYARENGIHTVRRVSTPVSEQDMSPEAVLEWINRDIVYSADEPRDITEDIIERLNAADAQAQMQPVVSPVGSLLYPATVTPPAYGAPGIDDASAFPSSALPYSTPSVPSAGTPVPPDAVLVPAVPQGAPVQPPIVPSAEIPELPEAGQPSVLPPSPVSPEGVQPPETVDPAVIE